MSSINIYYTAENGIEDAVNPVTRIWCKTHTIPNPGNDPILQAIWCPANVALRSNVQ